MVQFVAPEGGAGTSTIARAFAMQMAERARRGVWLVELDLMKGEQHEVIATDRETYGRMGEPTRASPNESMFFTVTPKIKGADGTPWSDARYMAAHMVGRSRLWVTRFRRGSPAPRAKRADSVGPPVTGTPFVLTPTGWWSMRPRLTAPPQPVRPRPTWTPMCW